MSLIKADKISFKYDSQIGDILHSVSFRITNKDKTGLIGRNGSGKSTLFKLILGIINPYEGNIFKKEGILIGWLPQELAVNIDNSSISDFLWQSEGTLYEIYKKIYSKLKDRAQDLELKGEFCARGGYSFQARLEKTAGFFGFDESRLDYPLSSLSAGEKTKLAICRIMLMNPDIILLDEPTNHIDLSAMQWLEDYLAGLAIPCVIISHDREFLDNCTEKTWELSEKGIREFSGNYSFYKTETANLHQRNLLDYKKQQKKIKQLRRVVQERKSMAGSMESFKPRRSVKKNGGICKRDAGSQKRVRKHVMRSAMAVETRIKRMIEKEEKARPFSEKKRSVSFIPGSLENRWVIRINNLAKEYDSEYVFRGFGLSVERNSRIAVLGKNGSGKSTLLRILAGLDSNYEGEITRAPRLRTGYYAQEFENLDFDSNILDEILCGDMREESRARTILGSLNIRGDKVYQKIRTLSIGERSKTALAKIIFIRPNLLLLDEPTNHLEIEARESFENALDEFPGAIILVSHDRYFIQRIANNQINMENYGNIKK